MAGGVQLDFQSQPHAGNPGYVDFAFKFTTPDSAFTVPQRVPWNAGQALDDVVLYALGNLAALMQMSEAEVIRHIRMLGD